MIVHVPVALRLVRSGSTYTGYYSTDRGVTWSPVDTVTVAAAASAGNQDVGIFHASGLSTWTTTATFKDLLVQLIGGTGTGTGTVLGAGASRLSPDLGHRPAAGEPHRQVEVRGQVLQIVAHAGAAGDRQARTRTGRPISTAARSERQRLEHVGAAAHAGVEQHRDAAVTASTTAGSASSVAIAPSTWRPPWLETMTPSMPSSTARAASSGWRIPLSTIGRSVRSRRNGERLPGQ